MQKLIIQGARGVGKSTLITRVTENLPCCGIATKKETAGEDGFCPVYIHPYGKSPRSYLPQNLIGSCREGHSKAISSGFEERGVELLSNLPCDCCVVMDELGFLERDAVNFRARVMELMDSDRLVIAAIKDKKGGLPDDIRAHPKTILFTLTPENREEVYRAVMDELYSTEEQNANAD